MPNTNLDLDALERALTGSAMGLTFRECQSLIKYARELEAENLELCGVAQAADAQRRELESASQPGSGEADMVMLPKEPTPEMQHAGALAIRFDTTVINKLWTGNAVYRAMVAAALSAPSAGNGGAKGGREES